MPNTVLQTTTSFTIHPSVVFSIIDQYTRRPLNQERVFGTLLGIEHDNKVTDIRHSFPVKLSDVNTFDLTYQRTMLELHQKVYSKETVIGWYATGVAPQNDDILMHQLFQSQVKPNALFLLVNTEEPQAKRKLRAFKTSQLTITLPSDSPSDNESQNTERTPSTSRTTSSMPSFQEDLEVPKAVVGSKFETVPILYTTSPHERSAVSAIHRKDNFVFAENDIVQVENSLKRLIAVIDDVKEYVQKAANGEIKGDKKIGKVLNEALTAINQAQLSPSNMDKIFNDSLQDLLMALYLSNLTSSQLSISEKLHNYSMQ